MVSRIALVNAEVAESSRFAFHNQSEYLANFFGNDGFIPCGTGRIPGRESLQIFLHV